MVLIVGSLIVTGCGKKMEETSVIILDEAEMDSYATSVVDYDSDHSMQVAENKEDIVSIPDNPLPELRDDIAFSEEAIQGLADAEIVEAVELSFDEKVQIALGYAGYYTGQIDGKIGSETRDAIKTFQQAHGLSADGMVGDATWDKLSEIYYEAE